MAFFSHTLQSSNQVISSGDVVGILAYAASNESSNGDARLISGSIESVAEGDFTAVSNPASLVFSTSTSADAVEQMRLTSVGYLGINTEYPSSHLHVAGNAELDKLGIGGLAGDNRLVVREAPGKIGGAMVEGTTFPGYMITDKTGNDDIVYGVLGNSGGQLLINADFTSKGNDPGVGIAIRNATYLEVTSGGVKVSDAYTLPTSDGSAGQVIKTDGNGNLSFQDDTTGSLNGAGVANYVARWSDADTLTTGVIYDDNTNVGIGISTPALQSAGKGLHINSDNISSEIKLTNLVTGASASQGVALVASNSSFTINNRSAGELNINTNNINAISIDSIQDVDVKQLLKVRRSNTVGTAGSVNRISYYDDGNSECGVGVSTGNIDYIATGSITQSFYTGGERLLRLDGTGKIVAGRDANLVIGSPAQNGNIGIGGDASLARNVNISKVCYNDVSTAVGINNRLTAPSGGALNSVRGIYQDFVLQDGVSISSTHHFTMGTITRSGDSDVDTCIGYYVNDAGLVGSASNYGIYSDVSQTQVGVDAQKWGLFLAGTAPNYYRGGMKTSISEGRHGSDYICERVAGGYKALGNTSANAGYLKIRLPEYLPEQKAGSTMLMFDVSVYEYKTGGYKNFHLGGYVYWNTSSLQSQWINTTATMEIDRDIDNANPWIFRFAVDEDDYPCVLIGRSGEDEATNWQYGQVYIQNVRTGFGRTSWDQWSQNWEISLEARDITTGGYYNMASGFVNKPFMQNQVDYKIVAGGTDVSSPAMNQIIIDQNQTVFNQNGVNTDFRVESDANQHMIFVDASADVVGIGLSNPRADAQLHVGGPIANPTLMIGTGGNISSSICSLKFQDRGPASDQNADGQITGYVQMERDGNSQNFDMTFGTVNTTAGDAVERMRIDKAGLVGIGTNAPSKLLHVDNSGNGAGTSVLIQGDDDSYMSVQNSTSGDFLKLGSVYTNNNYMGLSHSNITNTGFMIMSDGTHTFLSCSTNGRIYLRGGKNDANQGEIRVGDGIVQVNPSALNVDFRVCGDSVTELLRLDASKDSVLIGSSSDGGVNSRLYVYDDGAAKTNVTNSRTLQVQGRAYTTLSGTHYHIGGLLRAEKWLSGGSADAGYVIGLNSVPVVYSDSAGGQNTLTEVTSIRANMSINSALADGVNITNAYDIKCIPSLAGTNSTVTNHYGLYLTAATNGATTVTNAYGVFQADNDASNRFSGNMTIGSTVAPDVSDGLTVYGNISAKGQDGKLVAKDQTVVTKIQASVGAGGGIVGTESNHDLIIRANNLDIARFVASDGAFQLGKGINSFATPKGFLDVRGSAYFETEVDAEALTFKKIPPSGPYTAQSVQQFQVGTLSDSLYLFHSENPAISGGSATEVTCAIRMTGGKVSINAPPTTGLVASHFPAFTVDTNSGRCTVEGDTLQIAENKTPSSSSDTGTKGDISWDDNYVYVCVSTNTWKRTAISTW